MEEFDVFIVGGGMAGSNLARFGAEGGLKVLFIERHQTPRHKPCSGIQFPYFEQILDVKIPDSVLCNHAIEKTRMELPNGKVITGKFKAFNYMRNTFDHWLNGLAQQAGAELRSECNFRGFCREGEYIISSYTDADDEVREVRSKYLVDASGLSSLPVRRQLRPGDFNENPGNGGMNYYVDGPADLDPRTLYQFWNLEFSDAMFAWIYTKTLDDGRDYWCIGTGCVDGDIEERQEAFYTYVRDKFNIRGDIRHREHFVASIDYNSDERVWLGEDNILMVGDAAGFLDGVRGVGQDAAALSARLCARAIIQAEAGGGSALDIYRKLAARMVAQTRRNQQREISRFKHNDDLLSYLKSRLLPMMFSMTYHRFMNRFRKPENLVLMG
jgi:electron transfer flavoprotein-quinone oxidoreductase